MATLLLGALCALPLAHAHMQMINPSPFRDPHGKYEPKDWDILKPLNADGSNFACKGYHLNTQWNPTATYEAGGNYKMQLQGSATHGGGSCQLSMSFDGGSEFKVIKSMEGGCPEQKEYNFTVPQELGKGMKGKTTTGLFAWTWFNKIGNREMYMNCAVVNIVPKGSKHSRDAEPESLSPRDTAIANAAAQSALSSYPQLFVANLASENDCVTKETQDVIFDSPGHSVQYADGKSSSANPSFGKGKCTGRGSKNAGSSSPSSSSPPPSSPGGSSPGDNGQWKDPSSSKSSSSKSSVACNDGQWHPECLPGGNGQKAISGSSTSRDAKAKPAKKVESQDDVEDVKTGEQPSGEVEKDLQDYLSTLYGPSSNSKRGECGSTKRNLETCQYPSRWMKKSLCLWLCVRKGRSSKRAEDDLTTTLEIQLATLATNIARLMKVVSQKQSLERRQPLVPGALESPTGTPTTFDQFLTYLSQLQSTVIECIRGLAAAAPTERPLEAAQAIPVEPAMPVEPMSESSPSLPTPDAALLELSQPLPTPEPAALLLGPSQGLSPPVPSPVLDPAFAFPSTPPEITKRQLVVPDVSMLSWLNNLDPSNLTPDTDVKALISGLQGLGKDIVHTVDALQGPRPARHHGPPLHVLPLFRNVTRTLNGTRINLLQAAADEASFAAALAADGKVNTPPSPSSSSSTTSKTPLSTAAALLPWLMGPGPVVPPGVIMNWPGPNKYNDGKDDSAVSNLEHFPIVVNDVGDEDKAREQVKKFFEDLGKGAGASALNDVNDIDKARAEAMKFFRNLGKGAAVTASKDSVS